MDEKIDLPWWRTPLQVLGVALGLVLLAAASMALIFLIARFADFVQRPAIAPPPPHEQNARTRVPSPYGPVPWPDSPGRKPAVGPFGGGGARAPGGTRADEAEKVPTGVPVEEYRATVGSGKKLYLPDPKGECDLGTNQSGDALERCLAGQAAR
jgi:hypothetical protein